MRRALALLSVVSALIFSAPTAAQDQDDVYFRFSTQFRGPGHSLDVFIGGPKNNQARLDETQNITGQFWLITPVGDGYVRLTTVLRGPKYCLDVEPTTNRPELRPCGNYSGQLWRLTRAGDWVRITTAFRGPNMCLDIDPASNQPELRPCGHYSGQYWQVEKSLQAE